MQMPKAEDKTQGKGLLIIINALTCSRAAVCPPPGLFIVLMKDGAFNYTDTEGCSCLRVGEGYLEPLITSILLIARVPIILMVIKVMTLESLHLNLHHGSLQFFLFHLNTYCWKGWPDTAGRREILTKGAHTDSGPGPAGLVVGTGAMWWCCTLPASLLSCSRLRDLGFLPWERLQPVCCLTGDFTAL